MKNKYECIKLVIMAGITYIGMILPAIAEDAPTNQQTAPVSPAQPKADKPLSPQQLEARKRIERIKAEQKAKLEKAKADPNYEKKLEKLKREARIKHLKKILREEETLLQQNKINIVGGKLKTKPNVVPAKEVTKAPEVKAAPAPVPAPAPTPAPIKPGSVTNPKPAIHLLSDDVALSNEQDTLEPLDILDQAEAEVQDARDKLLQGIDSGASDEDLATLLQEETRASAVYLEALELTKEYYSQIQAAVTADPSLGEGIDLSAIPELLADLDQAIKDEEALSTGNESTAAVPEDQG